MMPSVPLCLTSTLQEKVSILWKNITEKIQPEENDKALYICIVYIIIQEFRDENTEDGENQPPAATVSQLLDAANINIMNFFMVMRKVKGVWQLKQGTKQHFVNLERKYLIVSALYDKYEKIISQVTRWEELQEKSTHSSDNDNTSESFLKLLNEKKLLCWMLFISSKINIQNELITTFYLLLCCLDYVIKTMPGFLLQSPFDAAILKSTASGNPLHFLQILCEELYANYDEVKTIHCSIWLPFIQNLLLPDGLVNISALKDNYRENYRLHGDLDEMRFLDHDEHLLPLNNSNFRSINDASASKMPATPVQVALHTVRQLKNMLHNASDQPSTDLLKFFKNCSVNPTQSIKQRISRLEEVFVKHFCEAVGSVIETLPKERYQLAVRMYYSVLESMLKTESERLAMKDFSDFLRNDIFHRALLACCTEVVLMMYGTNASTWCNINSSEVAFPWVLQVYNLKAYTFCRVLKSFVKDAPKITKDIIQHLKYIEDRIVEELAWQADSPLFEVLKMMESSSHNQPRSSLSHSEEDGELSSPVEMFSTPTKSPHNSNRTTHNVNIPRSLTIFLNKVGRLAYRRLEKICSALDISSDLQNKIWGCIEYSILCKPDLMKNHHLDQIMMCSIYAICKISGREIMLKTIVNMCKEVLKVPDHVFKSVYINDRHRESIKYFYNTLFTPEVKNYVVAPSSLRQMNSSLFQQTSQSSSQISYPVPGHRNFLISPLKNSIKPSLTSPSVKTGSPLTQLTPRTQQMYCFGNSPRSSEKLQDINECIRLYNRGFPNSPSSKTKKRLVFETESGTGEEDNVPCKIMKHCNVDEMSNQDKVSSESDIATSSNSNTTNSQSWAVNKLVCNLTLFPESKKTSNL